jgi:hypothetical protein
MIRGTFGERFDYALFVPRALSHVSRHFIRDWNQTIQTCEVGCKDAKVYPSKVGFYAQPPGRWIFDSHPALHQ